jgi:hypothetical protein
MPAKVHRPIDINRDAETTKMLLEQVGDEPPIKKKVVLI